MNIRTHTCTGKFPSSEHEHLNAFPEQQQRRWNVALHERLDAYRKKGKPIAFYDQCRPLAANRVDHPEFNDFMVVAQRTILSELDEVSLPVEDISLSIRCVILSESAMPSIILNFSSDRGHGTWWSRVYNSPFDAIFGLAEQVHNRMGWYQHE